LAGVAPADAEGLDWTAGMGEANVEEFGAATRGRDAAAEYLVGQRELMLAERPESVAEGLLERAP
jgi:hypothetical protein